MAQIFRSSRFIKFFVLLVFFVAFQTTAHANTVHINKVGNEPRDLWPLQLLKTALSYSQEQYDLIELNETVNQGRMSTLLSENKLDVMWAGTKPEYENAFRPIRVPLYKGLLGHRIFIIRSGEQHRFSAVKTFDQLLKLKAGQGRFWGDTEILENADIPVVKPVKYESLFHMLDGGRFDYFPRAVHEPWAEYQARPELNLEIEKELMLVYPMPLYFFTNKSNEKLAKTIEDGLLRAIDDGVFDDMFFQNPDIKSMLQKAKMSSRRVFNIPNPTLSPLTPLKEQKFWVNLSEL